MYEKERGREGGNECVKRGHEGERGSALDRGGPGKIRGHALPPMQTRCQHTRLHLLFCSGAVVPRTVPSFFSSFHLKASGLVPSHNPSLHLDVCVSFFFFQTFSTPPLCSISKSHLLYFHSPPCSLTFSFFFIFLFSPFLCILRWLAS